MRDWAWKHPKTCEIYDLKLEAPNMCGNIPNPGNFCPEGLTFDKHVHVQGNSCDIWNSLYRGDYGNAYGNYLDTCDWGIVFAVDACCTECRCTYEYDECDPCTRKQYLKQGVNEAGSTC